MIWQMTQRGRWLSVREVLIWVVVQTPQQPIIDAIVRGI